MDLCPCGSRVPYDSCCRPLIKAERKALTAEQLMRARYSAYVKKELEFVYTSLHPGYRADYDEKSTREWAESAEWRSFEILETRGGKPGDKEGTVKFTVTYAENGVQQEHREVSTFKKKDGTWYFVTGRSMPQAPVVRAAPKTGRNDPCTCGSGRKFKKCCGQTSPDADAAGKTSAP